MALDSDDLKTTRIIGNAFTEITFAEGLKLRSEIGIDQLQLEEYLREVEFNSPGGSANQLIVHEDRWLTNQLLTYSNTFDEAHSLNITTGLTYEETLRTRINLGGTGFLTDDLRNLGSAATVTVNSGDRDPTRLYGLLSRASYNYKEKYLVEGSYRRDGSSRFGRNNRFGNFWSIAAGWTLSEESFIEDLNVFDYLSLRASYGVVGNDRLGTFPSLALFAAGSDGDYNGNSGIIPSQPENPDLKWEESTTLDVGIKTSFLNNRLGVDINYFKRVTDDLLLNQVLPPQTGFNTIAVNVGELQNTGWEIDINSTNFNTTDFKWTTSLNISFIDNKINRLNADAAALQLLNSAISNFQMDSSINPENDLFYGNDYEKWIKAANTLKMRIYLNTRLVDSSALTNFEEIISSGNYIQTEADDFQFQWGTNEVQPDNRHPWYEDSYTSTGGGRYMSNWLMNTMLNSAGGKDPRMAYYFYRQVPTTPGFGGPPNEETLECGLQAAPAHYSGFTFCG